MTELTWLAELIANYELTPKLKKHVIKRMKQIDGSRPLPNVPRAQAQAPSTLAALERQTGSPLNQAAIATTPQAQAALTQRQMIVEQALGEQPFKGLKSPMKMRGQLK